MAANELKRKGRFCASAMVILSSLVLLTSSLRNDNNFIKWDGERGNDVLSKNDIQDGDCLAGSDSEEYDLLLEDDFPLNSVIKGNMQQNEAMTRLFPQTKRNPSRKIPMYHTGHQISCLCDMEYRVLDLGLRYYPKFIYTGICRESGCPYPYKCKGKQYKVHVLRRKEEDESPAYEKRVLPENLRKNYTSEMIPITVACECVPQN